MQWLHREGNKHTEMILVWSFTHLDFASMKDSISAIENPKSTNSVFDPSHNQWSASLDTTKRQGQDTLTLHKFEWIANLLNCIDMAHYHTKSYKFKQITVYWHHTRRRNVHRWCENYVNEYRTDRQTDSVWRRVGLKTKVYVL